MPRRIFTVTGTGTASETAETIRTRAIRILEQSCSGARLRHLPDGTAEVDVDQIGASFSDHPRSLRHDSRLGTEDLHRERMFVRADQQVTERALVAVRQAGAAHHLRADESCAVPASLASECLHADACHGREDESGRNFHPPDPPRATKVDHGSGMIVGRFPFPLVDGL